MLHSHFVVKAFWIFICFYISSCTRVCTNCAGSAHPARGRLPLLGSGSHRLSQHKHRGTRLSHSPASAGHQLALPSNISMASGFRTKIWYTTFTPKYVIIHVFNERKHSLIWDQIISPQQKLFSCWDVSNLMQPTVYRSQMWFIT